MAESQELARVYCLRSAEKERQLADIFDLLRDDPRDSDQYEHHRRALVAHHDALLALLLCAPAQVVFHPSWLPLLCADLVSCGSSSTGQLELDFPLIKATFCLSGFPRPRRFNLSEVRTHNIWVLKNSLLLIRMRRNVLAVRLSDGNWTQVGQNPGFFDQAPIVTTLQDCVDTGAGAGAGAGAESSRIVAVARADFSWVLHVFDFESVMSSPWPANGESVWVPLATYDLRAAYPKLRSPTLVSGESCFYLVGEIHKRQEWDGRILCLTLACLSTHLDPISESYYRVDLARFLPVENSDLCILELVQTAFHELWGLVFIIERRSSFLSSPVSFAVLPQSSPPTVILQQMEGQVRIVNGKLYQTSDYQNRSDWVRVPAT